MNETELLAILARGEDSRYQFKENFSNVDSLAAEWVAFANSDGGLLIVGANDAGEVEHRMGGFHARPGAAGSPSVR